jgi:hypothetical protein
MSKERMSFKELIQSNIDRHGYHITIVGGVIEPRFAYSIGLSTQFNFELVLSGGIYYLKEQVLQIFNEIVDNLRAGSWTQGQKITIDTLGEFSFLPVHQSWSKMMLLGVFDYYKKADMRAYQIVPDAIHFTYDIPDMSRVWSVSTEPVWQWLSRKWPYNVPESSKVVTNLEALQGEPITELMRWEEDEWEMFAGPGPEVQKEDTRVVSLGTILGIDNTLFPAVDLETGKGLWRTDRDSEWQNWG